MCSSLMFPLRSLTGTFTEGLFDKRILVLCLQPVLSALLDLLLVLEKPPSSLAPSTSRRKPCRHDDVLRLVLTHMEAEHKVALRRVYASALPLYIHR